MEDAHPLDNSQSIVCRPPSGFFAQSDRNLVKFQVCRPPYDRSTLSQQVGRCSHTRFVFLAKGKARGFRVFPSLEWFKGDCAKNPRISCH